MKIKTALRCSLLPVTLACASFLLFWYPSSTSSTFSAHFIDVGQGDSILLRDDTGFDVLVDGGKPGAGPTVVAYLRDQGVDDIDVMIASHADSDHVGGLIDVLNASDIPVVEAFYNGYPGTTQTWQDFTAAVANEGLTLIALQFPGEYSWGSMQAYVLNPSAGLSDPEQNDASVVMRISYSELDLLLTGDIDAGVEAAVVARGTPVAADILKVPHHGSSTGSSPSFLSAVNADDAIISVGTNSYGHPAADTLSRLLAAGARIYRTDVDGTIVVRRNGTSYEITPSIFYVYLPMIMKDAGSSPPTPPPEPDVDITYIFFDGIVPSVESDEYAEITNVGTVDVDLDGWRLNAGDPGQDYYFPAHILASGASCRVYTNEVHPETCGFNFARGSAIWKNSGDCGYLYDDLGVLVSTYCYGS